MSDEFRDYKSKPTPDNLIRLLRAHQDRVYRLCLQVLRRPHDAEDAAQEVLVKIASGVRTMDDPDAFHRWVYRVSLNRALEAARKVARRRVHESRAAMKEPPQPIDEETRRALFEGIAKLDDAPRGLILDHYFEGETLESLASREGVSPQAVSKRLDRARDDLRRTLPASLAAAVDLSRLFDRGVAPPLVPDLVSGPVLAKVAAVAGGTLMASKSSVIGVTVAVALTCFVAGAGTGAVFKGRSARGEVAELTERLAAAESRLAVASAPGSARLATNKAPHSTPTAPEASSHKEAATSKLKQKLARYRAWIEMYYKEYDDVAKSDPGGFEAYRARKNAELGELLVGMRDLVCASPAEFLEFLRNTKNETYLRSLILRGLGFYVNDTMQHGIDFREFPRELHDGMLDLLIGGSLHQKRAMLEYFALIWSQPPEFKSAYPQFLNEPEPSFQQTVIRTIARSGSWTDEAFAAITRLGQSTDNSDVRMEIGNAMLWAQRPEAFSYLIDRLEATTDHHEVISVGQTLMTKIMNTYQQKRPSVELEDRIARAVSVALGRGFDGATFLVAVRPALELPAEKLKPLLQQALALAPTDHSRKTVERLLELVNQGNTSAAELRTASWDK